MEAFETDGAGHFRRLDLDRARQVMSERPADPMPAAMEKATAAGREAARRMADESARFTRSAKAAQARKDRELKDAYQEAFRSTVNRVRLAATKAVLAGRDPVAAIDAEARRMKFERLAEDAARIQQGGK